MSKVHWNTISVNKDITDLLLKELIDHSYDLVCKSLTKKAQSDLDSNRG
jgi:predicted DNA-binding protein (MmcQ/YjbR family)